MKSVTFGGAFIGLTLIGAIGYIIGRIAFLQSPALADVFSVVWTVVLCALIYLVVRYTWRSPVVTTAERRREVYRLLISIIEVFVFGSLLLMAVAFSNFSATPGNEKILTTILIMATASVTLLVVSRTMRVVTRRRLAAQNG